jgi:hypothetical protein
MDAITWKADSDFNQSSYQDEFADARRALAALKGQP